MKHLYYVRHGLSEMNTKRQRSGHSDTPLHPEGHNQARLAGKLAREQGLVFDAVLSSPLERAHHTAQHIARAVDYDLDKIILDERLKERCYGVLEGKVDTEAITAGMKAGEHFIDSYDNVESIKDAQRRADELIAYLKTLDHETILIVSHGAFGRALHRAVNNLPMDARPIRYENAKLHKLI